MFYMFHNYNNIISLENLYKAWREFVRGKNDKKDVMEFSVKLSENIYQLHLDISNKNYTHGDYYAFKINDPKPRDIHKATVRDRLLHHAIYRIIYPFFDKKFVYDSYSCRLEKGTHKAMDRFRDFARKESLDHTKTCFVLKCDIRKFFASIDHKILITILREFIKDENIIWLLGRVTSSFSSVKESTGLPLGNLTSQLFANVYLNELDQFLKHEIKVRYYIRYADDFVILSRDKKYLKDLTILIGRFLFDKLKVELHPNKVFIKTFSSGVDFLGWVHFPKHRVLRTVTKKRMTKRICEKNMSSYLGLLSHGDTYKIKKELGLSDNEINLYFTA